MEIKGKIIQVLPPQGGVSKQGNTWRKQEFVLETLDSYPKQVKFDLFGDRIDNYPLAVGDIANYVTIERNFYKRRTERLNYQLRLKLKK